MTLFAICAVLLVSAVVLLVLVGTLAMELAAKLGLGLRRRAPGTDAVGTELAGSYVVVIPAHNEVGTIEDGLASIIGNISSQGRVLVVADNCTDDTAGVAAAAGASVITRQDPSRRGKSYALDFAVRSLETTPPDVVIIIDADCIPESGAIQKLFAACLKLQRPIQARYEMTAPEANAGLRLRAYAFAWRVRNWVRPMGLKALGIPCLLMGTGMAFPWNLIAKSHLKSGHLVEDMVLGLELAAEGEGPEFLPEACVQSSMPPSQEGQKSQRLRWETGHLQVIRQFVPRLLLQAIKEADFRLFGLALHTAVPPLGMLVTLLGFVFIASGLSMLAGGSALAFEISALTSLIAALVLFSYWVMVGRDLLSIRELLMLPGYALSKLLTYGKAISGQQVEWIRSKRD